ncbi:MAG TPA: lipoprotein-releasing ABC transporter permease subunit [Myxococcota bacterium]|nr:lipoprotein-releasing ABC transporter permease subunit [Myxococcota bacterium]
MSGVLVGGWTVLTAAGGTVALALILAIALGINAMTLLFFGSAVVALERFARVATRWRVIAACGLVWALLLGAFSLYWREDVLAGANWAERLRAFGFGTAVAGGFVCLLTLLCRLGLRFVAPRLIGAAALAVLGIAAALVLGATANLAYAAAPAVVAGTATALLALRRRWLRADGPSEVEQMFAVLAASVAVGMPIATVLPEQNEQIAAVGAAIFALVLWTVLLGLVPLAVAGIIDRRPTAEWFIAVRYLLAKRRQTFISIITGICVVGIAAGVWLIITVLSVMNGFERTWRDEIIGNRAHFTVQSGTGPFRDYRAVLDTATGTAGVVAASPYLDAEGMVRGEAGEIVAVRLRGVDPALVAQVTDLRDDIIDGSLDSLAPEKSDPDAPPILIGSQLASSLGLRVGQPLLLISPFGGPQTPLGPAPRLARFTVVGIFETSFFQYDEMYTYTNLPAAQAFKRLGDVADGIEARTTDYYRSRAVAERVQHKLGFPYYTRDWKEFFPAFFQALKTERVMMFILLAMIMVVAAFSIVSTLVMMIMEKSSDIAILKAMGAEDDAIERIFALEGTLIGLVGTALGVVAGISVTARIAFIQHQIENVLGIDTLPASIYQVATLPAELDAGQIALAVGLALVLALGATLLPSRGAARLDPVESLRYE